MTSKDEPASGYKRPGGLTDLSNDATRDISATLRTLLADVFALYLNGTFCFLEMHLIDLA
jgi:hypothetical protein